MSTTRKFKIVVAGDSGVGKSAFVSRNDASAPLAPRGEPPHPLSDEPTMGVAFVVAERTHTLTIDDGSSAHRHARVDVRARHQIYDLAGRERFRESAAAFFRDADAVVFVYNTRSAESLASLRDYWVPLVACNGAATQPLYFLLGTHATEETGVGDALADEIGAELALEIDSSADGGWRAYDALTEISLTLVTRTYDARDSPAPVALTEPPRRSRC